MGEPNELPRRADINKLKQQFILFISLQVNFTGIKSDKQSLVCKR